jgi:hypothetical protein
MVSKGVDFYSYTPIDGVTIKFWGSGDVGRTNSKDDNFTKHHLELDSSNIGWTLYALFKWDVIVNGQSICSRQQWVNVYTGNLNEGDLSPLMNTDADFSNADYIITFGLYDAGTGWVTGLPNAHQAWVTVTPNLANWMSKVAPLGSEEDDKPFSTFVLPAAHDAGMNTMNAITTITTGDAGLAFETVLLLLFPAAVFLGPLLLLDLAMTQKETTYDLLEIGVRYFDFRPAYLPPVVRELVATKADTLYHTHLIIPGQRFDEFLRNIVGFLRAHAEEIVVVRTCADGIKYSTPATHDEIDSYAKAAVQGTGIRIGDRSSFQEKIINLRTSGTRLIIVKDNPKYDSYSDDAYATIVPDPIIKAFSGMSTGGQSGRDFTVLQCQGTSTNIPAVIAADISDPGVSTSSLMATKAYFDCATLPWIRQHALSNLKASENLVIMNDFIDGATTYTAYELSQARLAGKTSLAEVPPAKAIVAQAAAPPSNAPILKEVSVDLSLQGAQQLKVNAEKELEDMKFKHARLEAIVAATKALREDGKEVDEVTLEVQEGIKRGLAKNIEAQQEAIAITEKRVEATQAGNL